MSICSKGKDISIQYVPAQTGSFGTPVLQHFIAANLQQAQVGAGSCGCSQDFSTDGKALTTTARIGNQNGMESIQPCIHDEFIAPVMRARHFQNAQNHDDRLVEKRRHTSPGHDSITSNVLGSPFDSRFRTFLQEAGPRHRLFAPKTTLGGWHPEANRSARSFIGAVASRSLFAMRPAFYCKAIQS